MNVSAGRCRIVAVEIVQRGLLTVGRRAGEVVEDDEERERDRNVGAGYSTPAPRTLSGRLGFDAGVSSFTVQPVRSPVSKLPLTIGSSGFGSDRRRVAGRNAVVALRVLDHLILAIDQQADVIVARQRRRQEQGPIRCRRHRSGRQTWNGTSEPREDVTRVDRLVGRKVDADLERTGRGGALIA